MIKAEFSTTISDALRQGDWIVTPRHAIRRFNPETRAFLFPSGHWAIMNGTKVVDQGRCGEVIEAALTAIDRAAPRTEPEPEPAIPITPTMTRTGFLLAYETEMHVRYSIPPYSMEIILRSVVQTLDGYPGWDFDHEACHAAWRRIGGQGLASLSLLRQLPKWGKR